jgi:PAS domain-containing protein
MMPVRVTGIAHVARDISERKRAEMALRESEKKPERLFRAIASRASFGWGWTVVSSG